jgi:4-hydroxy-tetrahydrodipicolinate synthase
LLAEGTDGLSVLGTTGEANSMTVAERVAVLERLVDAGIDPARLMPGTGCCAIEDTVTLTRAALRLGITDALVLPPFYYKAIGDDGIFDAYAQIIERIGDDRFRLFFYHIPQVSGAPVSPDVIRRVQAAYPQVVAGIKDSSRIWENTEALTRIPNLSVFCGSERLLLQTLQAGGAGCIAAMVNVNAPAIKELLLDYAAPDAHQTQARVSAASDIVERGGAIPSLKAILAERHPGESWNVLRPPLRALDAAKRAALLGAWNQPVTA